MKPITTNQEILLFADTSFSKQEFCNKDSFNKPTNLSRIEELERACWAGMLFEMLPELVAYSFPRCKMFIWNIQSAEHSLLISQGTDPHPVEATFSIDPHFFLPAAHFN
jgi:hypothetical protein